MTSGFDWNINIEDLELSVTKYGTYTLTLTVQRTYTSMGKPASVPVRTLPDDAREALALWLTTGGPAEPPVTPLEPL